jgi:Rrf2 family transcriptional regulator, cysteine metabolism repressor
MKLSTKCRYGLRAMIEIARNFNNGTVNRKTIAKAQHISKSYLENILISLREKNLIRTTRGATGGFILLEPPSKTTVLQIVNALEGSIAPVDCIENPAVCEKAGPCPARKAWRKLYEAQNAALSSMTLQDLLDMEAEESRQDVNYVI